MKYLKLLLPALLIALMLLMPIQAFAANNDIQLYLNDQKLNPEVSPQIVNGGTTIVPVRIISEALQAKVTWLDKERKVRIEQNQTTIEMKIDDPVATVNGKSLPKLDAAPTIVEGNTLVPIRFVAEQFGLKVGWDGETQSVLLYKMAQESATSDSGGQAQTGKDGAQPGDSNAGNAGKGSTGKTPDTAPPTNSVGGDKPATGTDGTSGGGTKPPVGNGSTGSGQDKPGGTGSGAEKVVAALTKLELSGDDIVIQTNRDVTPKISTLSNPYRIVIDLPNAELGAFAKPGNAGLGSEIAVQHPKVDKIRYALYNDNPSTVRIVLDMKKNSDYQLTETKANRQWSLSLPDKQFTVVIDAGHGGSDPGALSLNSRKEKDFTLSLANKVYKLLQKESSIRTLMTRTEDTYPTLDDRVVLANDSKADLFVSIHGNSYKPTISGTETYYLRTNSLEFANVMHKWLIPATAFPDRGVRQADYKVIRETTMPAILLEIGYLTNKDDEAQMYAEPFQDRVAAAIVNGIKEQLQIAVGKSAATSTQAEGESKTPGTGAVKTASESEAKTSETKTTDSKASDSKTTDSKTSDVKASDSKSSDVKSPDANTAGSKSDATNTAGGAKDTVGDKAVSSAK